MFEITGTYNSAKVFTDNLEPSAEGQIKALCEQPFAEGSRIRVMPDVHAGKGCTIGLTMTVGDYVAPNLVGADIGCGILAVRLKEKRLNLPALDSFIYKNIPFGRDVRERPHRYSEEIDFEELRCYKGAGLRLAGESLGTLGGGNHFIEADKDDDGNIFLVIHTGSRNPGLRVAEFYREKAYRAAGGRKQSAVPYELAFLTGADREDYLADMSFMRKFASLNRRIIKDAILDGLHLHEEEAFETVHNYIDTENMILRKGAVSAQKGEKLLIPINMRDGGLICTGLGNADWNFSAPHGAGRQYSRKDAKANFTVAQFKKEMAGIYTTSVSGDTLDECPKAYKPRESITANTAETVKIEKIIKPIYNFKAGEGGGGKRR